MLYLLLCLFEFISFTSGSEPCTESLEGQYQCWNAAGALNNAEQSSVCIRDEQRCADQQRCHCPWCDDQWNCPTFEDCQANGGFVCSHSLSSETGEAWACIPEEWACDGIWDCPSGEDESREFCNVQKCEGNHNLTYWYQCSDNGRCIDVLTVGDGENDCVNGEDEDPEVIARIGLIKTSGEPDEMITETTQAETATEPSGSTNTQTTSSQPNNEITEKAYEYSYGIDLLVNIWGVESTEVCTAPGARFDTLERVLASTFSLNTIQVTCSCQLTLVSELPGRRRLWHSSSPSASGSSESSESSESSDSNERPEHHEKIQKVLAALRFEKRGQYVRTLQRMLSHVDLLRKESSSSDSVEEELDRSIQGLNNEVGKTLSDALRKLVRVEILRISGNA